MKIIDIFIIINYNLFNHLLELIINSFKFIIDIK